MFLGDDDGGGGDDGPGVALSIAFTSFSVPLELFAMLATFKALGPLSTVMVRVPVLVTILAVGALVVTGARVTATALASSLGRGLIAVNTCACDDVSGSTASPQDGKLRVLILMGLPTATFAMEQWLLLFTVMLFAGLLTGTIKDVGAGLLDMDVTSRSTCPVDNTGFSVCLSDRTKLL